MSVGRAHLTDHPKAYRAVLVTKSGEIEYRGPYGTLRAAKGIITSNTNHTYMHFKSGWVEETPVGWEKVAD